MVGRVGIALLVLTLSQGAFAQPAETGTPLNDTQKLGQKLFYQSCVVCHTKPQITSGQYGPVLSKDTLGGQEDGPERVHRHRNVAHAGLPVPVRPYPDQCHRRVI